VDPENEEVSEFQVPGLLAMALAFLSVRPTDPERRTSQGK
jgi:hypothetical protein